MRVFVTGGTGNIGSGVVRELLDHGHEVVGLARSDASAAALEAAGVAVHRGELADLDGLRAAAAAADGVVHMAFVHDFTDFTASAETDLRAVRAMGAALEGSGRPLIIASGTSFAPGRTVTEADEGDPRTAGPRGVTEQELIAMAGRNVRSAAVRFPPTVHGAGDVHGFIPRLIGVARDRGVAAFAGDGTNRWPAVHRLDAAHLVRLALEGAPAGSRLHGVDDEGVPLRHVAEVIGRHLGLPVKGIAAEDAAGHFGWLGALVSADVPATSTATRALLGWRPRHAGLLADLDEGHYFQAAATR
ncbi:SDR family oxidoreductase [Spirillospora sp. NPDC048819]|uniref:SDR family oxidoreductase n=1 Tax=Spirillospora sp. NPDC048819 TaxID=3155268 RepID=UPI0034042E05